MNDIGNADDESYIEDITDKVNIEKELTCNKLMDDADILSDDDFDATPKNDCFINILDSHSDEEKNEVEVISIPSSDDGSNASDFPTEIREKSRRRKRPQPTKRKKSHTKKSALEVIMDEQDIPTTPGKSPEKEDTFKKIISDSKNKLIGFLAKHYSLRNFVR